MVQNNHSTLTPQEDIDDPALIDQLREGDDAAFLFLVNRHQAAMLSVAAIYVSSREVAEDVVQETWIAMLKGLDRFEGRSSLKTWLFSILVNHAKTRAQREQRYVPMVELSGEEDSFSDPTVEPERFTNPDYPGHWAMFPSGWNDIPEEKLLSEETMDVVRQAIQNLPVRQQQVIALRDIDGRSSEEVCNLLTISETNQRVLLHRARAAVRRVLEVYLDKKE
jgi:RNA polymerase sigma-70 factor (ECF subfamily)